MPLPCCSDEKSFPEARTGKVFHWFLSLKSLFHLLLLIPYRSPAKTRESLLKTLFLMSLRENQRVLFSVTLEICVVR